MSSSSPCSATRHTARRSSRSTTNRLGSYLAAGLGATTGITASSDAAIIDIDIGPSGFNIGGVNGGLPPGFGRTVYPFPFTDQGDLALLNRITYSGATYTGVGPGLYGSGGLLFATVGSYANPAKFLQNASIGGSATWTSYPALTMFKVETESQDFTSPDFGPNNYLGFQTADGNYGWLEVTWSSATSEFQILSGAYESVPGVAIPAGVQAVPEPSTLVLGGIGALVCGGAALRRLRKQKRA